MIKTSCEHCIFREGMDCKLGLVEKYREQGKLDESNDFPVVNRVCLSRRHKDWLENLSEEEKKDVALSLYKSQDIQLNYIILVTRKNKKELKKTLESISSQSLKPSKDPRVVLVLKTGDMKDYIDYLEKNLNHTNFFVTKLFEDSGDVIDQVFSRCQNGYYYYLESGMTVPSGMYFSLWYMIFKQAKRVIAVIPRSGIHHMCVSAVIHKFLKGSSVLNLREKLLYVAKEQNLLETIYEWKSIYESVGNKGIQ